MLGTVPTIQQAPLKMLHLSKFKYGRMALFLPIEKKQLRRILASNPHTKKSSHDTTAKALTILRLTGWLLILSFLRS